MIEAIFYLSLASRMDTPSDSSFVSYQGNYTVETRRMWRNTRYFIHLDNGDTVAIDAESMDADKLMQYSQANPTIYYTSRGSSRTRFCPILISMTSADHTLITDSLALKREVRGLGIVLLCFDLLVWAVLIVWLVFSFRLRMLTQKRRKQKVK